MKNTQLRRPYRALDVNKVSARCVLDRTESVRLVVAIDVAKEKMVSAVMDEAQDVLVTVKWCHPVQSESFYEFVAELGRERRVEVVMEPTGTYGDALRFHLVERGFAVYHVKPNLVHDARELYDGVPSSHDAKACGIIGMLHLSGRSVMFAKVSESRRRMKAATATLFRYEKQFTRERAQLDAVLVRFWPGITDLLSLSTKSLLTLLSEMGSSAAVTAAPSRAREILVKTSKHKLSTNKIDRVLENAAARYGEMPLPEEVEALKLLAADALRTRANVSNARKQLETLAVKNEATHALIPVLGKASSGAFVAELGSLRDFASPASLVRCLGLNLREVSSGQFKGRLRITKRGSPRARHYLFYAALRCIYRDPIVRAWYAKKRGRSAGAGLIGVVAVMRKLARALWHVARGAKFDAAKLYDTSRLELTATSRKISPPAFGMELEVPLGATVV